MKPIQFTSYHA